METSCVGVLSSLSLLSLLLKCYLSVIGSLFLLDDLLDVHVDELVFDLGLLLAHLIIVELLATSQTLLQNFILAAALRISLLEHAIIVTVASVHKFAQLSTHLCLIIGAHSELVADRLLRIIDFLLLLCFKIGKTFVLELLLLVLNILDALTLLSIVRILEHLSDLILLVCLVFLKEVSGLLGILVVDGGFSNGCLLFDLLGVLLFLELAAAFETLLKHTVELLLLTLLVHVHQTVKLHQSLLVVLE